MSLKLDRMYSVLTAGERARLVLKAIKEESREDPIWRSTAPPYQAKEFNRLIHLINGVDKGLGGLVLLLEVQASALAERVQALEHFKFVAGIAAFAGRFVAEVREPISATDYESRRQAAAGRILALSAVAELEVEAYTGWGDNDFLPGTQQMVVTDAARQRVKQEKLVLLYELVRGVIPSH